MSKDAVASSSNSATSSRTDMSRASSKIKPQDSTKFDRTDVDKVDDPDPVDAAPSLCERLVRLWRGYRRYNTWSFRKALLCLCCIAAPRRRKKRDLAALIMENAASTADTEGIDKDNNNNDTNTAVVSEAKQQQYNEYYSEEKAAITLQCFFRCRQAKACARSVWNEAIEDGTDYWEYYLEHGDKTFKYRQRREGIYIKNVFSKVYVSDVIATSKLFVFQSYMCIYIQKMYRGYRVRTKFSIYKNYRKYRYVSVQQRSTDSQLRQVWARRVFEPREGWPVRQGWIDYDMMEYKNKPPAGEQYGRNRTHKVIIVPRSTKEREILLDDEHSWVGLPIYVQSREDYIEEKNVNKQSLVAMSLKAGNPYLSPLFTVKPTSTSRKTGLKALKSLGWNSSDVDSPKLLDTATAIKNRYKQPPPVFKLSFDHPTIAEESEQALVRSMTKGTDMYMPSIYDEKYRENFLAYDAKMAALAEESDPMGSTESRRRDANLTSYLQAIEKERNILYFERYGFKAIDGQRTRHITPLRGAKKYLSAEHKKAYGYSSQHGALASLPMSRDAALRNEYKETYGINVDSSAVSAVLLDTYRNSVVATVGNTVHAVSGGGGVSVTESNWDTSTWASVKKGVTAPPSGSSSSDRDRKVYRVFPSRKKKHYKLRYTWLPQPMVAKSVNLYDQSYRKLDRPSVEEGSFVTQYTGSQDQSVSVTHKNNFNYRVSQIGSIASDTSFATFLDSVKFRKIEVRVKKDKFGNEVAEDFDAESERKTTVQLKHTYMWR